MAFTTCFKIILKTHKHVLDFHFRTRALPEQLALINRGKMKGSSKQVKTG